MSFSESGRTGTETMLAQFHLKALQAVLAVRDPRSAATAAVSRSGDFRRRDKWFHLAVVDPPPPPEASAEQLLPPPPPGEPVVFDVILSQRDSGSTGDVVERWTWSCEPWTDRSVSASAAEMFPVNKAYKRLIILLRSLYATLRLLPAFRIFKAMCASASDYNYEMSYRLASFAEPFSRELEARTRTRRFAAVDTQLGKVVLSVQYKPNLSDYNLEVVSLMPPVLIADYVGSPAADPMRAFPGLPSARTTELFDRPHSWAPTAYTRSSPPPHYASPTPSPPAFPAGYLQSRLRGETTAPVSIPQSAPASSGRNPTLHRNLSEPVRQFFPPPSPKSGRGERVSQEFPSDISRSFRKAEGIRAADIYNNVYAAKGKDGRDDSGRFSGALSSGGSPRLGVSRSSSRLSIPDDDDAEYPFAVDDVDPPDSQHWGYSGKDATDQSGSSSHKSQDAAVGFLVHMLKTARPLRDAGGYSSQSNEVGASSSVMSRKTSDAIDELQSFREIKEMLQTSSRSRMQGSMGSVP